MNKRSPMDAWLGAVVMLGGLAMSFAVITAYIALTYRLCVWVWKVIVP
jgi:hypothetical protein